jgi:hypothetical protein
VCVAGDADAAGPSAVLLEAALELGLLPGELGDAICRVLTHSVSLSAADADGKCLSCTCAALYVADMAHMHATLLHRSMGFSLLLVAHVLLAAPLVILHC